MRVRVTFNFRSPANNLKIADQIIANRGRAEWVVLVYPAVRVYLVAQGRVWSGTDAHELGLVDELGDLDGAIAAAAELAGLGESYTVSYIEKEKEFKDKVIGELMAEAVNFADQSPSGASPVDQMLRQIERAAADFGALNDPNHVYVLSNIEAD